jgi:hypothetical protein
LKKPLYGIWTGLTLKLPAASLPFSLNVSRLVMIPEASVKL